MNYDGFGEGERERAREREKLLFLLLFLADLLRSCSNERTLRMPSKTKQSKALLSLFASPAILEQTFGFAFV